MSIVKGLSFKLDSRPGINKKYIKHINTFQRLQHSRDKVSEPMTDGLIEYAPEKVHKAVGDSVPSLP